MGNDYTFRVERAIDQVTYKEIEGDRQEHDVILYALSTCAFCRRAIEYLKKEHIQFRYAYLDQIDVETKRAVKRELAERFDNIVVFPILVVDDQRAYSGFTESVWARALDIE
jgi:glutaredoxin